MTIEELAQLLRGVALTGIGNAVFRLITIQAEIIFVLQFVPPSIAREASEAQA
jgi:hypothetical protein